MPDEINTTVIDVIICTKNSSKTLANSIDSIFVDIPVNRLIIVDGYSTDDTLAIIEKKKEKFNNIYLIQTSELLGKSREIGIEYVETDFFAFIDSDVVIPSHWFKSAIEPLIFDEAIGAVEGNFFHHYPDEFYFPRTNRTHREPFERNRGYTIATIIRKSSLVNLNIPSDLKIFEDEWIRRTIERNGYIWMKINQPIVDHYPDPKPLRDAYLLGEYSFKYHIPCSPPTIFFNFIITPARMFKETIDSRSIVIMKNIFLIYLSMVRGVVSTFLKSK